ncbi:MAG: type II toxin-antitoxin system death-on-curing family toxin [Fuerstiella sp.]
MQYLQWEHLIRLHQRIVEESGGSAGIRDKGLAESALAQPLAAFGGQELYPSLIEKAAALCYSLVSNHPFVDGNKRIGHGAMETFLAINGFVLAAEASEAETTILNLAAGQLSREELTEWVRVNVVSLG